MDYMEESSVGMDTFRSIREKYKLPLPVFKYDSINTVVTFPRNIQAVKDIGGKAIKKLTNEEFKGYEWIKSQGEISAKDYTAQFGVTSRTTSRHLGKMLELKLIKTNNEHPKSPKLRYIIT